MPSAIGCRQYAMKLFQSTCRNKEEEEREREQHLKSPHGICYFVCLMIWLKERWNELNSIELWIEMQCDICVVCSVYTEILCAACSSSRNTFNLMNYVHVYEIEKMWRAQCNCNCKWLNFEKKRKERHISKVRAQIETERERARGGIGHGVVIMRITTHINGDSIRRDGRFRIHYHTNTQLHSLTHY